MSEARARRVLTWLPAAFVALAVALVAGRVALSSAAAVRAGDAAMQRQDTTEAIRSYANAVRLYLPGSPFNEQALARLEALAAAAPDSATERRALEAARGAVLATRSLYTPFEDHLARINARLAILLGQQERAADHHPGGPSLEARTAWHAARLASRPGPAPFGVASTLLGCALWLGAAVGFFTRGLDRSLRLRRTPALAAALTFVVGVALFVVGLRLA